MHLSFNSHHTMRLKDYPVERFFRDLRVHEILEGTNEIMRVIIGRDLLSD